MLLEACCVTMTSDGVAVPRLLVQAREVERGQRFDIIVRARPVTPPCPGSFDGNANVQNMLAKTKPNRNLDIQELTCTDCAARNVLLTAGWDRIFSSKGST